MDSVVSVAGRMALDWDVVIQRTGAWYDRMVAACQEPSYAEQLAAFASYQYGERLAAQRMRQAFRVRSLFGQGQSPRVVMSRRVGDFLALLLAPAGYAALEAETRARAWYRQNLICFALAGYHADHGRYPERLRQLVPKYIRPLPKDPFTDRPFRYRREPTGFLIYCLGPNMKDNGGKEWRVDGTPDLPPRMADEWDDYGIRIPTR